MYKKIKKTKNGKYVSHHPKNPHVLLESNNKRELEKTLERMEKFYKNQEKSA